MDYGLANFAAQMSPEDRSLMTAQLLRRQQGTDALAEASRQGNRFNSVAAIAQMANNQGAARAAEMAAGNAQRQFKPVQMGNQGFMLPNSGEFIRSPMFEEEQAAARDSKRSLLEETLRARAEQARMLEDGRNARAEDANALRAMLASQSGQLRLTIAEMARQARLDRESQPKPKSPAELKAEAAAEKAAQGREGVSNTLDVLHGHYLELDKKGGIQNTDRTGLSNVLARTASSGIGQTIGGALGTKEQSIRNSIQNIRPLLLQDIKNATGMTTGQLNSNMELKTYMDAATDPTLDIQANLRAIAFIDQKFGTGKLLDSLGISPRSDGRPAAAVPPAGAQGAPQAPAGRPRPAPAGVPPQAAPGMPPGLQLPPGFRVIGPAQ